MITVPRLLPYDRAWNNFMPYEDKHGSIWPHQRLVTVGGGEDDYIKQWASDPSFEIGLSLGCKLHIVLQMILITFYKTIQYSVSPIYRGRVYRGIGYIAVACWTPFFWRPRARYFLRNSGNTLDPIRGRQFFAKSAHRDSLCSRFAGDNFLRNQLWPTCQCGLEHMLCDGQPSLAEHWHLHCIAE